MLYLNAYWLNIGLRYKYVRYDTRCYFNVRSKADISQLNLPYVIFFTVCRSYISHCVSKCVMSFCLLNDYWLIDWLTDWIVKGRSLEETNFGRNYAHFVSHSLPSLDQTVWIQRSLFISCTACACILRCRWSLVAEHRCSVSQETARQECTQRPVVVENSR